MNSGPRLRLRRGTVVSTVPLIVDIDGDHRRAWNDDGKLGPAEPGDEVVVNVTALDLGLGSGGFDIVHVNLTRGLGAEPVSDAHVMKLNYTSLQHPVDPVELSSEADRTASAPVLIASPHGHLAPILWAARQERPDIRVGYVQIAGGALPGSFSRDVAMLQELGLLDGHITVAPCFGGLDEAISIPGAIDAAVHGLGWDAVVVAPGPGILGSATPFGHGSMSVLDAAHAACALGLPTRVSPRMSTSDPRPRHQGLSHHTATVLGMLLAPVTVAAPDGVDTVAVDELKQVCADAGHALELIDVATDLLEYGESRMPRATMGRDISEDPLFFAAPLASGRGLARAGSSGR